MIGRVAAAAYVVTVAALTAVAFSDANGDHWTAEIAAAALALPLVVPALPFVYVVGGLAWDVTDADSGGPMWVVTLVYAVTMAAVATGNVLLLRAVAARRLRTPSGSGPGSARRAR